MPKIVHSSTVDGYTKFKPEAFEEIRRTKNFGSSNLHIVHGAFKSGAEASGWNLKKLLKSCFQLLKDRPARRGDFINVTESIQVY